MAQRMLTPERTLLRWHRELNRHVFDGELPTCPLIIGKNYTFPYPIDGAYYPNGFGVGLILLDPACPDLKATLAHEMIHQWQDLSGLRLTHKGEFKCWQERILALTGLSA